MAGGDLGCADSSEGCGTLFKIDANGALSILHVFEGSPNGGAGPQAGLLLDEDGNLYGATIAGGAQQAGTVFKLDASGIITILYEFTGGADGIGPELGVRDEAGNLYGTTGLPSFSPIACTENCGTVFKLAPDDTLTVLHTFNGADGAFPVSPLIRDVAGNLFGTANQGGAGDPLECDVVGCGVVFKIDADGDFSVLHHLMGGFEEGRSPSGRLLLEEDGSLVGTTAFGGTHFGGTVYKIQPDGEYVELHAFQGGDIGQFEDEPGGNFPQAGVVQGLLGNLYGTTAFGGVNTGGVIFELDADSNEKRILHTFTLEGGGRPLGPLVVDSEGNLYGTGLRGGDFACDPDGGCGTVFKLALSLP